MNIHQIGIIVLLIVLLLISGLADAQGFVHASKIWQNGSLNWSELMQSAAGFGLGIVTYWISARFLQDVNILSPEMQSLVWFTVTIIGVAIFSGKFLHWPRIDQIVGIAVLIGMAWLLARSAG